MRFCITLTRPSRSKVTVTVTVTAVVRDQLQPDDFKHFMHKDCFHCNVDWLNVRVTRFGEFSPIEKQFMHFGKIL
jgi:hypothetical protein